MYEGEEDKGKDVLESDENPNKEKDEELIEEESLIAILGLEILG